MFWLNTKTICNYKASRLKVQNFKNPELSKFILKVAVCLQVLTISSLIDQLPKDKLKINQIIYQNCLIQLFEADFLWNLCLKILNSGIILKTFTHEALLSRGIVFLLLFTNIPNCKNGNIHIDRKRDYYSKDKD